jgi:hypothetical protein
MGQWARFAGIGLLFVCAGACDPEAAPLPDVIECMRDSDCDDDSRFCNGEPTCQMRTHMTARGPWRVNQCVPGESPCGVLRCLEATDRCDCSDPDPDDDGADSIACGGTDCDDTDPGRAPGGTEICDPEDKDEDCDSTTFGERDRDGDGSFDASCCNGSHCGEDCDDANRSTHPRSVEVCDGRDNDCDAHVDEGVVVNLYVDADHDGWGVGDFADVELCAESAGYSTRTGDCDDEDPWLYPGRFRCVSGPDLELCADGAWASMTCPGLGLCVPQPNHTGVCLPGDDFPECSDGEDNDGDALADFRDPECTSPLDNSESARLCGDGMDNDGDTLVDYPDDPGCSSAEDNDEANPVTPAACSNGLDDDGDGTVDYVLGSGDPGCSSASDPSEREVTGPACDNGLDDDGDGSADYPADITCLNPTQDLEQAECANGVDDDLDGLIDYGTTLANDPGCLSLLDLSERNPQGSACDNGVDDDLDGAIDYPGDTDCTDPKDVTE